MIFRSPYPDLIIDSCSITQFVLRHAERLRDKPALIDVPTGCTLTYGQLVDGICRTAAGLADRGFVKSEVAAIYSPNHPEYGTAFHGIAVLGGTVATINHLSTVDEVTFYLNDSGARFLFAAPGLLDKARAAAARTQVEAVFELGHPTFCAHVGHDDVFTRVEIEPEHDVAALCYSSGTTGQSKAVMLTHTNLIALILQFNVAYPSGPDEVLMAVPPFYHLLGLDIILNRGLALGATIVSLPRFELIPFLAAVQRYRVTHATLVPPIVLALAKHPAVDDYDLSSLRLIVSGAAPLDEGIARACVDRIGCQVRQGYGMTECCPIHLAPDSAMLDRLGSVGPCAPNTECKVVDVATGAELGPGVPGEILVRGPQTMKGYLNRPDATAATIDADGWLRIGDIGYADEEGWFTIVDRLKELIKYNGYQVAPAELEAVLLSHTAVADAAVIPSPDENTGEVPKAFVVLSGDVTADELMAFVAARVAPHKKIRRLEFVEEIPKSPSGKILRRILVERERATLLSQF